MALLKLICVALCVASVSAATKIHRLQNTLHAKSVVSSVAGAQNTLGAGVSRAQIMSEYQAVLKLMADQEINAESTAQYTAAKCTALITSVNKDVSKIKASVEAFMKASGSKADAGNANWWMHSGTASYLYGIRNALTDVDMHWHGMAGNVGHIEYKENSVGNPVEVDSYDPCVDKTKPFFQTLETGIRLVAATYPITAEVKSLGYRVITLAQLKYEYENLVKDMDRQSKPHKKKSDAETLAGIDAAAKTNNIPLGTGNHGDPLTF